MSPSAIRPRLPVRTLPLALALLCALSAGLVSAQTTGTTVVAKNLTFATVTAEGNSRSSLNSNPIPIPAGNNVYMGAHIDWTWEKPDNLSTRFGRDVLGFSIFLPFPLTDADIGWFSGSVRAKPYPAASADGRTRPQVMITFEPRAGVLNGTGLAKSTDVAAVVAMVQDLNERGVRVFVRWAHEMNGWWSNWAMRPTQYKALFRQVALAIQACKTCNMTAMLWAPQVGVGYPWGFDIDYMNATWFANHTDYAGLNRTELALLDTNGDGKIAAGDEPYQPYWPGDDVVDWVGLSIYYAGRNYGEPSEPYPNMFSYGMRGLDYVNGAWIQAPDFYGIYSETKGKPFCLAETSVMHITYTSLGTMADQRRMLLKQDWWRQTISNDVFDRFPNYRSTWLFEWKKVDTIPGYVEDFSYTLDKDTRDAFNADLPASRIVWANGQYFIIAAGNGQTFPASGVTPSATTTATRNLGSSATYTVMPQSAGSTTTNSKSAAGRRWEPDVVRVVAAVVVAVVVGMVMV